MSRTQPNRQFCASAKSAKSKQTSADWSVRLRNGDFDIWMDKQLEQLEAAFASFVTLSSQRRSLERRRCSRGSEVDISRPANP